MKVLFLSLLSFLLVHTSDAQILKGLGKRIKGDAEWRVRYKTDQQVAKGLDSLAALPKKINEKKKAKRNNAENTGTETQNNSTVVKNKDQTPSGNIKASASDENNDMTPQDGYVTLKLSANSIFTGGRIMFSGESVKARNFTQVAMTITGSSAKEEKTVPLAADGKYNVAWNATGKAGEYTVLVKSSDKKAQQSAKFTVYDLPMMENWCDANLEQTNKAYDRLKEAVAKVMPLISPKDKMELNQKMNKVKENVEDVLKLYTDLNKAGKELAPVVKQAKTMPPDLAGNLSDLNDNLADQAGKMKKANEMVEHQPQDNTICEYLVMVNEACAAFSTFTNGVSKSFFGILKNIALDKGVPKAVDVVNTNSVNISAPADFVPKEAAKIFATSKFDAKSLTEKLGKAGIAGDVIQFISDVLLKIYCGVYKGELTHDYTVEFRNGKGEIWWSYGVTMKAMLSLRYPKKNIQPTVLKMKGNLEGNAIKFDFFEDVEKEDGFQEGSKGKIEVVPIKAFSPLSVSFATSERDILGFGAIARGLATPAYFNIPIDAEYDVDAKKIKIFINEAIIDFTDLVANQFVFLLIGGDLLPYPKKMTFPIHKARLTINAVVSRSDGFMVEKDAKGNESFVGKGNRHIGDHSSAIETDLNFTISAKKD